MSRAQPRDFGHTREKSRQFQALPMARVVLSRHVTVGDTAIAQARAAAGDRQLTVVGGATRIQALLRRGAVDELQIDMMPVLLRDGLRLFENLGDKQNALERVDVHALPHGRMGLRFGVKRWISDTDGPFCSTPYPRASGSTSYSPISAATPHRAVASAGLKPISS